ncbi:MAG: DNA polymerase IV [Pseudomonadota bacterium]
MVSENVIIHLDMDAFYAAVEVLDDPSLRGRPVIVGGTRERGVVSTASYEARVFGIHSAQPIMTARKLCPGAVFLPVRMRRYQQVSERIMEVFRRFTPLVEPLSLDEAFLDVAGSRRLFGSAEEIALRIKRLIRSEIGLTVSAGVAPIKLAAKIASDLEKPDGLTIVPAGGVREFLAPLPIGRLWGVGRAAGKTLRLLGVETIGDLAGLPLELLERNFGRSGRQLALLARGIDERAVEPEREAKSIGAEETFQRDITRPEEAARAILGLTIRACRRLRRGGLFCRTVTLKIKFSDFKQITRSATLPWPADDDRIIYRMVHDLLGGAEIGGRPIRLLGVSLSRLEYETEPRQGSLFQDLTGEKKGGDLNRALDRISAKYGDSAVVPAVLLKKGGIDSPD